MSFFSKAECAYMGRSSPPLISLDLFFLDDNKKNLYNIRQQVNSCWGGGRAGRNLKLLHRLMSELLF